MTIKGLAAQYGVKYITVWNRIDRGMTLEEALTHQTHLGKLYTINGETKNIREWAEYYGVNYGTVRVRLNRGKSIRKALGI